MKNHIEKYVKHGYSIFPVRSDKKPYFSWEPYQHKKPTGKELNEWWGANGKYKNSNIAIVTGKISDLTVVDIDSSKGEKEIKKYVSFDIHTPIVKTPGGGYHLYFQYEKGVRNKTRFLTDCDIRSEGGYVLAPPSENGTGNPYFFVKENALKAVRIPSLLLSLLLTTPNYIYSNNIARNVPDLPVSALDFKKGSRDDTLFHIANTLAKGGMQPEEIEQLITLIGLKVCQPPFPQREIKNKVKSALNRLERREANIMQEVKDFIAVTNSNFRVTDVSQTVTRVTKSSKAILMALSRLVKAGEIERLDAPGMYRVIKKSKSTNIKNVKKVEPERVLLPFGLDRYCQIFPGDLIVIAGVTNSGKSALIFNMIRQNMSKWNCYYLSTEMKDQTVKNRVDKINNEVDWDFEIIENWDQSPDSIMPNDLNFCDWIEAGEEPYRITAKLNRIHEKLNKGIAIVALQKNPGQSHAFGGYQTLSKASLYLTLDKKDDNDITQGQWMKVAKAKAYGGINPNGFVCEFKIVQGINLIKIDGWGPDLEGDRYAKFRGNKR